MIEDSNEPAPFLFFNKFVNKCRNDIFAATNTINQGGHYYATIQSYSKAIKVIKRHTH
jgi:hypothetical protein